MAYKFPDKIFPSRVTPFLRCPFQFKCKNDKEIEVEFVETPATFTGKVIHNVLEKFFDISRVPLDEREKVDIAQMVREAWAEMTKNGGDRSAWTGEERRELFGSRSQERAYGLKTIIMIKNFLAGTDLSAVPLAVEEWMDCEVDNFTLAGRIDRIDQESSETIAVWDYKTGKLPYHKSIEKMMEQDFQVPIYSVVAGECYPGAEKIRAGLIYVKYSRIFDMVWTREEIGELKEKLIGKLKKIKETEEFPPRLNKLCPWCDYKDICPAYKEDK